MKSTRLKLMQNRSDLAAAAESIEKERKIRNHQTVTKQSSFRAGGESWPWVFRLPLQPERPYSHSTDMRILPSQAIQEDSWALWSGEWFMPIL